MIEGKEKKDYFYSFLRTVETDLKNNKTAYVFNKEQLETIKQKYNVRIVRDEGWCMYIRLRKENKL